MTTVQNDKNTRKQPRRGWWLKSWVELGVTSYSNSNNINWKAKGEMCDETQTTEKLCVFLRYGILWISWNKKGWRRQQETRRKYFSYINWLTVCTLNLKNCHFHLNIKDNKMRKLDEVNEFVWLLGGVGLVVRRWEEGIGKFFPSSCWKIVRNFHFVVLHTSRF